MRNKFEHRISKELAQAVKRGKLKAFKYEAEKISYILNGSYLPDFIIETDCGKVYVECKGYLRPEDKRKLRAVKVQHPEMDLRILFYGDATAREKDQIRWAQKNGFKYAVHKIPKEWLLGL